MESKGTARAALLAFAVAIVIKLMAFDVVIAEGRSMLPTVKPGSVLLVNRLAYGLRLPFGSHYILRWAEPRRGDILIFPAPDGRVAIKRCAAPAGVAVRIDAETVRIGEASFSSLHGQAENFKSFESVPKGSFLALGDNSPESLDSRQYGFVSSDTVLGRIVRWKR